MTDKSGEFIANILKILAQNGYPEKKVALPLEKLYESAHNNEVNFNKVLAFLLEEKSIAHEKTSTKIIFFPKAEPVSEPQIPDAVPGIENMEDMIKLGQQMFGDIADPEKIKSGDLSFSDLAAKARGLISTMTPEQIKNLQKMVGGLSEEQKQDLMKKARDLGIK